MEILRRLPRMRAGVLVSLVLGLAAASAVASAAEAALPGAGAGEGGAGGGWARPVDGAVLRPFEEPTSVYGPGHRGVDLAAAPGTHGRARRLSLIHI